MLQPSNPLPAHVVIMLCDMCGNAEQDHLSLILNQDGKKGKKGNFERA